MLTTKVCSIYKECLLQNSDEEWLSSRLAGFLSLSYINDFTWINTKFLRKLNEFKIGLQSNLH